MSIRLSHIAVLLFLPVFLFSATGFRLVKHTCHNCGVVEYALFDNGDCCPDDAHDSQDGMPAATCCHTVQEVAFACKVDCCELESRYFKTGETLNSVGQKGLTLIGAAFLHHGFHNDWFVQNQTGALFPFEHSPPPRLSGKSLLFALHQLKLDCHQA
jgi:hypothetical protein